MEGEHMRLHFTKMEGLGNDYVYVNCFKEKVEHPSELAVRVSDRHFGIGSDGLILIKPSEVADFKMDMYNADGTQSEMCGNGIRCVGKYVYDYGLTDKTSVSIETLAGIKYLEFTFGDEEKRTEDSRTCACQYGSPDSCTRGRTSGSAGCRGYRAGLSNHGSGKRIPHYLRIHG